MYVSGITWAIVQQRMFIVHTQSWLLLHTTLQSSTLMGGAVWFNTHKLAMIATVVLSVLGMVPVIIDRKLEPIKRLEYHPMVGLAVIVICLCQPVIAYFRPGKVPIP